MDLTLKVHLARVAKTIMVSVHKEDQIGSVIVLDILGDRGMIKEVNRILLVPFKEKTGNFQKYHVAPRRHIMATAKELKEKAYFDVVYKELEGLKMKVFMLREELARTYGADNPMLVAHDRHFVELAEYIDWKLQVLEKGTSFDWKTAKGRSQDIQSDVSVQTPEGPEISGGYIGG
jgi:hypothetical protein